MRTCEAIGHQCKLMTNNKMVLESDFYNPNNIYVYDIDNFFIPNEFLKSDYIENSVSVYNRYSLKNWVKEVLDDE